LTTQWNLAVFGNSIYDSTIKVNYEHSVVLLQNKDDILPLKQLNTLQIASLVLENTPSSTFEESINRYGQIKNYHFNTFSSKRMMRSMIKELSDYNMVLVFSDTIDLNIANFISQLGEKQKVILTYSANHELPYFNKWKNQVEGILLTNSRETSQHDIAGQVIFGGYPCDNILTKDINEDLLSGHGLNIEKIRLSYGKAQDLNISDSALLKIDTIVQNAITEKATPGCEVLAAKDGHVFFHRSYGHHSYDSAANEVKINDIYDLASITKIASSALILMQLESEGKFNVDSTLGTYLPELLDSSAYEELVIKDILTHQAGLISWIPFFIKTLDEGIPSYELYSKYPSSIHQNRVADDLYILSSYRDSIFHRIIDTKVRKKKKYRYSDLGYYFINQIIKEISGMEQNIYAENLYHSIGLQNIGYHPRDKWSLDRIPPTENDTVFRHQLIHGDVHDQGAAMMGGVGGHAGLFSNSNDLAIIMQLYLNKGIYGGDTLINAEIIEKYTSSPFYESNDNRRGITFDKPVRNGVGGPTCFECTSYKSFGHSGFTGNLTWADPESGIVYVFLSNRVHPDAENHRLINMNIRTEIMKVITQACNFTSPSTSSTP